MKAGIPKAACRESAVQAELRARCTVLLGLLLVPAALLGACSREGETTAPALANKWPKAKVKYQEHPQGAQQCSNCMNYIAATKECQRVEGQVSPGGWCVYWGANA